MRLQFDLATVLVVFTLLHRLDLVSSSVKCEFELPGFVCPFVLRTSVFSPKEF
jgi:hypothetical protein